MPAKTKTKAKATPQGKVVERASRVPADLQTMARDRWYELRAARAKARG